MKVANKVELFLDSGAFSAWSKGASIDIQEYSKFIQRHEDVIEVYANLDVIGDAKATLKNQKTMEEAGLSPIPTFHQGEDWKYLHYYIERYSYIALGGMIGMTSTNLIPFLDTCWNIICDTKDRMPKVKVHGFGLTSLKLMLQYPWYSVDSTSWVVTGRMGSIYMPRYRKGKWIYDENSWKIAVSNRSPNKKEAGKHFSTLPEVEKQLVLKYISEKGYPMGKSRFERVSQKHELKENERWAEKKPADKGASRELEIIEEPGLCNKYQLRDELNIIYFLDLEASMPEWPWAFTKQVQGFGL